MRSSLTCCGINRDVKSSATGFFHLDKIDGRWWIIDPDGYGFWSVGMNAVTYNFNKNYEQQVRRNYKGTREWARHSIARLIKWGFNTIGCWSSNEVCYEASKMQIPYTKYLALAGGGKDPEDYWPKPQSWWVQSRMGRKVFFPDPFDPEWHKFVDERVNEICKPLKDDPYLLGYFVENEFSYAGAFGGDVTGFRIDHLYNYIWSPKCAEAFVNWLRERYQNDISKLNAKWSPYRHYKYKWKSFENILEVKAQVRGPDDPIIEDLKAFEEYVVANFVNKTIEAIKKVDPNHMICGTRFASLHAIPDTVKPYGRYNIVTFNNYPALYPSHKPWETVPLEIHDSLIERMAWLHEMTNRPLMLTEFGFFGCDTDLPNLPDGSLALVETQAERAEGYKNWIYRLASIPYLVGAHWFCWVDGHTNYGVVDWRDMPYETLINTMSKINRKIYKLIAAHSNA